MTAPTKTPIDPSEIRAGDLIRVEVRESTWTSGDSAHEFKAKCHGDRGGWVVDRFDWFLLDRPIPPVSLPTEPTLGWLTTTDGSRVVGSWEYYKPRLFGDEQNVHALDRERDVPLAKVVAFTPATAVPRDALDKLRAYIDSWIEGDQFNTPAKRRIKAFLAAVDEATS